MRVLICGDRHWQDAKLVYDTLAALHRTKPVAVVIEGEARGADSHGRDAAKQLGIEVASFPADWEHLGRGAGPIRNHKMLTEGKPDLVLAFHDDLAASKGTAHMVRIARKAGVRVEVISHGEKL